MKRRRRLTGEALGNLNSWCLNLTRGCWRVVVLSRERMVVARVGAFTVRLYVQLVQKLTRSLACREYSASA